MKTRPETPSPTPANDARKLDRTRERFLLARAQLAASRTVSRRERAAGRRQD